MTQGKRWDPSSHWLWAQVPGQVLGSTPLRASPHSIHTPSWVPGKTSQFRNGEREACRANVSQSKFRQPRKWWDPGYGSGKALSWSITKSLKPSGHQQSNLCAGALVGLWTWQDGQAPSTMSALLWARWLDCNSERQSNKTLWRYNINTHTNSTPSLNIIVINSLKVNKTWEISWAYPDRWCRLLKSLHAPCCCLPLGWLNPHECLHERVHKKNRNEAQMSKLCGTSAAFVGGLMGKGVKGNGVIRKTNDLWSSSIYGTPSPSSRMSKTRPYTYED